MSIDRRFDKLCLFLYICNKKLYVELILCRLRSFNILHCPTIFLVIDYWNFSSGSNQLPFPALYIIINNFLYLYLILVIFTDFVRAQTTRYIYNVSNGYLSFFLDIIHCSYCCQMCYHGV